MPGAEPSRGLGPWVRGDNPGPRAKSPRQTICSTPARCCPPGTHLPRQTDTPLAAAQLLDNHGRDEQGSLDNVLPERVDPQQ